METTTLTTAVEALIEDAKAAGFTYTAGRLGTFGHLLAKTDRWGNFTLGIQFWTSEITGGFDSGYRTDVELSQTKAIRTIKECRAILGI